MSDILHQITINAPKDKVYAALSTVDGLAGWWTSTTKGESAPGKTLEFRFGEHVTKMRVEELDEGKHVAWQCTHSLPAWLGTRFTFDLTEDGGRTKVLFGHRAWKEASPFLAQCSMQWATFLLSLRDYAETGRGRPFPNHVQV
jgi:uncharacterized protein YndB with AHSA1/START domain